MTSILFAVAVVSGIGLVAGVGLAVAGALLREPAGQRLRLLTEALPGYNCGACGFPGCEGYAQAVLAGEAGCALCKPGRETVEQALEAIMTQEAESA